MKTIFVKPNSVERAWHLIDADGKVLGKVAEKAAHLLRGKHKPLYTPHQEVGDFVIIINAEKAILTGRKRDQKEYIRHSGYPSGLKTESFQHVSARIPTFPLEHAIRGMLPKGRLGRKLFTNVKVYAGDRHPHAAQKPNRVEL
jgi:large subunit ribosomal protein L13